jgi:sugar phosphate isomerase/epimerase
MIAEAGFTATTLWWEDEALFGKEKKEIVPAMARDFGLYIENIHVPFENCNDLWGTDYETRRKIETGYLRWLEDCAMFQIPVMVMHLTKGKDLMSPHKDGIKSMEVILRHAETLGVTIAIENTAGMDHFNTVLREFPSKNLGYCYDSSHDWLYGSEKATILKQWPQRLVSLHLSDNDGEADRHWLPCHGSVDWDLIIKNFPESIASGCLTMEVYPNDTEKNDGPVIFLQSAHQKITGFQNRLQTFKNAKRG